MFETAVLGPIATRGLGVVRQCVACRAALGPEAPACAGFGVGCLSAGEPQPRDAAEAPSGTPRTPR